MAILYVSRNANNIITAAYNLPQVDLGATEAIDSANTDVVNYFATLDTQDTEINTQNLFDVLEGGNNIIISVNNDKVKIEERDESTLNNRYDFSLFVAGLAEPNELLVWHVATTTFNIPMSLSGSRGKARVAGTGNTKYSIRKNNVEFGSINFDAGMANATFDSNTITQFVAGDTLEIYAPGTIDPTLEDITITIVGLKS